MSQIKLKEVFKWDWPPIPPLHKIPFNVLRNHEYLVQAYSETEGIIRLSVCRTARDPKTRRWIDGISWDTLQEIKNACGYAHLDAVEIYPREQDTVNVANIRHLWILPEPIQYAWRNKQ